jgi:transposase
MLQRALELRDERDAGRRSLRSTRNRATRLTEAIRRLCRCVKRNAANERLAGFLYRHAGQLFTFLRHPGLDATNWRGEHAMRYAVVDRKVWGGNRTHRGATTRRF